MMTLTKSADPVIGSGHVVLPRVNLLPPEILELRRFRRVQMGLGGGVVAALLLVVLLYLAATGAVSDANGQVDAAGAEQRALQTESAQFRDVTATYKRAADAQTLLTAALGDEVRYSRLLSDLSLSIPPNVWIKNIAYTQGAAAGAAAPATAAPAAPATPGGAAAPGIGTVTVSGVAYAHEDVSLWLESLAAQKGYAGPLLQSSTEALLGTRKVVNWSTTVILSADALSGRYAKAG